jgi:hypothetical protein
MYYTLFFTSLLSGIVAADIRNKFLVILILLATIPTTLTTLKDVYVPSRPPAMLGSSEMAALTFLSGQPVGVVLTQPFDEFKSREAVSNPPRPLYLYASTAYVSAFSRQPTFFEDEINLDITGYDWKSRRSKVVAWFTEKDPEKLREFLKTNSISYIYWIKYGQSPLDITKVGVKNIFENDLVTIYKVD